MKPLFGRKRDTQRALFDTTRGNSVENLLDRLGATIAWYTSDHTESLSRDALRPSALSPESLAGSRRKVVDSVGYYRTCFMAVKQIPRHAPQTLAGGRLLLYFPDSNLADGAAELETEGFFDCNNVPPWSLWLAYLYETAGTNYLVCWIPPDWVEIAARGIWVNPEGCIRWLNREDHVLIQALERAGLAVLSEAE